MPSYLAEGPHQLDIERDTPLAVLAKLPGICQPKRQRPAPVGKVERADIIRLDQERRRLKVPLDKMCLAADVSPETWRCARRGATKMRRTNFDSLNAAMRRLAAGERVDQPRTLLQSLIRLVTAQMARGAGWDPQIMLAQNFDEERPQDPVWRQAARLRRCAIYLCVEGLRVEKAAVGHAVGLSRQGAHKAVAEIEAERERDERFDAVMAAMMAQLKAEA